MQSNKKFYINNTNLEFDGSTLIKGLGFKRYQNLKMQMEADQVTPDHTGVFSRKYRPKNKPICYCFYATIKGQVPEAKGGKWSDYISDAKDVLEKKVTRSETHYLPPSVIDKLPEIPPQRKKRKIGFMASEVSLQQPILAVLPDTCSSYAYHCPMPTVPLDQPLPSYWDSSEAKLIFQPNHVENDALEAINNQLKMLFETLDSSKGYLEVVSCRGIELEEMDEEMSHHQRWMVQQKILVITLALIQAKEKMESLKNWDK